MLLSKFQYWVIVQDSPLNFSLLCVEGLHRQPDIAGMRKAGDGNSVCLAEICSPRLQKAFKKHSSAIPGTLNMGFSFFNTGIKTTPSETFDWYRFLQNAGKTHFFSQFLLCLFLIGVKDERNLEFDCVIITIK